MPKEVFCGEIVGLEVARKISRIAFLNKGLNLSFEDIEQAGKSSVGIWCAIPIAVGTGASMHGFANRSRYFVQGIIAAMESERIGRPGYTFKYDVGQIREVRG